MTMTTGTIPRKANTGTPTFSADPLNSTYRWEIFLTPGLKGNKVPMMDGYSKGMGFENTNKVELLYKKLVNPLLPYLYKSDLILIYEQTPGLPKHLHAKLLELYPRDFGAYGWVKETTPITDFLKQYYSEYLHTGRIPPIEDRRKNVRQPVYMKELDHSIYNFKTLPELQAFCRSKVEKYSAQCMHGWYYRHADFQPELFENDISGALAHAAHTAPSHEVAQPVRETINQMYDKFDAKREK